MNRIRENGSFTLASYGYDQLGRRISLARGNGTSTIYDYDNVSRLTELVQNVEGAATANDLTLGFTYAPAHQIPRVFCVSRDFAEEAEMSFDGGRGSFGFVIRLRKGSLDVVAGNGADPNVLALSAYTRDPQEVAGNRELADRYVETIRRAIGGQGRRRN